MTHEQRLINLRLKLAEAIKKRDYLKASKFQNDINNLLSQGEVITLSSMINNKTEEERDKVIVTMNKVFAFADLLQGYALDFQSLVQKMDNRVQSVDICRKAKEAARICLSITKEVSQYKDEKFNETFQNMCDEIDMVTSNIIYKHYQKSKNKEV